MNKLPAVFEQTLDGGGLLVYNYINKKHNRRKERNKNMKKILLPEAGKDMQYYRANLHCHTNISDGRRSPEEIKELYASHGYSVVAYTDHNVFLSHDELNDESFLALHGYEININDPFDFNHPRTQKCHLNLIALDPDNMTQICHHRNKYSNGNSKLYRDKIQFDESLPDYVRVYSPDGVNDVIKKGRDAGFFVTYNHPTWSLESYPDYSRYHGMNAMEIVNYGCIAMGYEDDNGRVYDDLLNQGKRLYCIATDDNHNAHPDDDPLSDSLGGYTMIAAPALEYRAITSALEAGQFYAVQGSCEHTGPEITSLVYEDGKLTVKTNGAWRIRLVTSARCKGKLRAAHDGEELHEACFDINPDEIWFRVVVVDHRGGKAYTNAYFKKDLEA